MSSSNSHVGPIIFADSTAREQLQQEGFVYTFRTSQRTVGETWWRKSRTGPKQGDVEVMAICELDPSGGALDLVVEGSGFEDVEAWRAAIRELNGDLPEWGYLYRAKTIGGKN